MPPRPRSRASKSFPKTLTGILASVALAVLAALGVKTDWFGKPTTPVESTSASATIATPSPVSTATAASPSGPLPKSPGSFESAKKILYGQVYADHRITFYCGCTYSVDRKVDLGSCGLEALADKPRAQRIEAEHIFPAAQFGNFRPCWRDPRSFPTCIKADGSALSGRKCCEQVDPVFETAHNDLFNLVPAVGEVNGKRSDYNWGMIQGEPRVFGTCNMEVDSSIRRVEPPESVQGDIARTMLYMADTYGFNLSRQDQQLYTAWSRQDPPDTWEIERNRRIKAIQGKGNRFVEDYAVIFGKATATTTSETTPAPVAPSAPPISAPDPVAPTAPITPAAATAPWTCGAKTICGQMSSCDEAKFYLTTCGVKRLDGDSDGVPCAKLCNR